jgi:hypothetical protein
MATETADRFGDHVRGMLVTTLASIAGLVAGVGAATLAAGPKDTLGLLVMVAAIAIQFPILRVVGIDVGDFGAKDYLYIVFMTFSMWFISWGVLLTTNASL